MPARVLLDTNFLMLPPKFRRDIFEEIERLLQGRVEFIIIPAVRRELFKLAHLGGDVARQAKLAIELSRRCKFVQTPRGSGVSADEALLEASKRLRAAVATTDLELRKKLRDASVPVIIFREKSKFQIEGIEAGYR